MKTNYSGAAALMILLLGGCENAPPPASAFQQSEWALEADYDTKSGQVLTRGESKESVIAKLGSVFRREKLKADPDVEILIYQRTIVGPLVQRYWKTPRGEISVRKPQMFIDEVRVYLRKGMVETAVVKRRLENDALSRSGIE